MQCLQTAGRARAEVRLSEGQRAAVAQASAAPVLVLTGGPGCGKTFTTRTIVKLWRAMGKRVCMAAPTGAPRPRGRTFALGAPSMWTLRTDAMAGGRELRVPLAQARTAPPGRSAVTSPADALEAQHARRRCQRLGSGCYQQGAWMLCLPEASEHTGERRRCLALALRGSAAGSRGWDD